MGSDDEEVFSIKGRKSHANRYSDDCCCFDCRTTEAEIVVKAEAYVPLKEEQQSVNAIAAKKETFIIEQNAKLSQRRKPM